MARLITRFRERRDEAGVTLVELSVTILLLGMVSLFVSGALISAQKIFRVGRADLGATTSAIAQG